MSNSTIKKQTKDLNTHMTDYVNATQQRKKSEAAIFNKYKLEDGKFGSGLNEELSQYRENFNNEWELRNSQFVQKQFDESRLPTNEELEAMHQSSKPGDDERETQRSKFKAELPHNAQQQKPQNGPKPR